METVTKTAVELKNCIIEEFKPATCAKQSLVGTVGPQGSYLSKCEGNTGFVLFKRYTSNPEWQYPVLCIFPFIFPGIITHLRIRQLGFLPPFYVGKKGTNLLILK